MKRTLAALGLVFLLLPHPAAALKISPFKAALIPEADAPTQLFRVDNNTAEPAAVQVRIQTWEITPGGEEINTDDESDFAIFPAQLVLQPGESKAVRVQWLGDTALATEKAYRVVAEQLPVVLENSAEAGSSVRFLLRFKAAMYITPRGAKSDLQAAGVKPGGDGTSVLVEIANKGTAHALMRDAKLHLKDTTGQDVTLVGDALKPLEGENIHAGRTRVFEIPLPGPPARPIVSAQLDCKPGF